MPYIRSILADHNGLAAHYHPVFGAESARDHFVLADAVYTQGGPSFGGSRGATAIDHRRSVKHEIVRPDGSPVGTEPASTGSGGAACRRERLWVYSRLQHRQVDVVPPVERQVRHALFVHHATQRAAGGID